MAVGYFYNPTTHNYEYGESPMAKPTVEAAAQAGDNVNPVAYSSSKDAGEISEGMGQENLSEETISGKPAGGSGAMGAAQGAGTAAKTMASGGSSMDAAGAGLTSAGAATANPYLVGAGLALQTGSMINKGRDQRRMAQYQAEVARVNARQEAINKLAQLGSGVKA